MKNEHITKEGHKSRAKVALCDVAVRIKALALKQDEKHSGGMYDDSLSTILNDDNETDDSVKLNLKDFYPSKSKISAQNLKMMWEKNRLCLQNFNFIFVPYLYVFNMHELFRLCCVRIISGIIQNF